MINYDNADLGIAALLLIALGAILTEHYDQGIIGAIVAAIAGIARPNNGKNGGGEK